MPSTRTDSTYDEFHVKRHILWTSNATAHPLMVFLPSQVLRKCCLTSSAFLGNRSKEVGTPCMQHRVPHCRCLLQGSLLELSPL